MTLPPGDDRAPAGGGDSGIVVGLLANEGKPAALTAARRLAEHLTRRGVAFRVRATVAAAGKMQAHAVDDDALVRSDFLVVFGGDGTLLNAARLAAPHGTPLLGIHLGHFGFLTEAPVESLLDVVDDALSGRCEIHERMMLQGLVRRADGGSDERLLGMNDIVVASKGVRMVHIRTQIGTEDLATYAADGVIVASPTGSTGYSLSAGGPLMHPAVSALIVTPIAPHTLSARALILPDSESVHLTVEEQTRATVAATVDGQIDLPLSAGDTVSVSRAPFSVRLLSAGGPTFTQKIRDRWHYAERLPQ